MDDVTLETSLFPEILRQIISMISVILGKDDDQIVYVFVLGCMVSICPPTMKPLTKFNYAQFLVDKIHHQFLVDKIHHQFSEFETLRSSIYQSYLFHLFLFSQVVHFSPLRLKFEYEISNPVSVIHWTSLVRKKIQNEGFSKVYNQFMSKFYQIIHDEIPPRVFSEYKKLLQLSHEKRIGDLYIF
jgi:hypothetical protein